MTAILNHEGHLILPPELKPTAGQSPGRRYDVMVSTSGVILLRPERKPRRGLVESFATLRGLVIEHRRDPIPAPPSL